MHNEPDVTHVGESPSLANFCVSERRSYVMLLDVYVSTAHYLNLSWQDLQSDVFLSSSIAPSRPSITLAALAIAALA